jgi:hypothetical protein
MGFFVHGEVAMIAPEVENEVRRLLEPIGLDLNDEHGKRYEAIRSRKLKRRRLARPIEANHASAVGNDPQPDLHAVRDAFELDDEPFLQDLA